MYAVLNFGWAQAPRLYCQAEGLKHTTFKLLGVQLAEYIDDSARPYPNRATGLAVERLLLKLGTSPARRVFILIWDGCS